jgi:hypothetical protein
VGAVLFVGASPATLPRFGTEGANQCVVPDTAPSGWMFLISVSIVVMAETTRRSGVKAST